MAGRRIAFRTDASSQIGIGHFMRCLTLADGLQQSGAHIRFVSRELPLHLRDMLAAKGMELMSLDGNANPSAVDELAYAHWLGTSQALDAGATMRALSDQVWDWLVVDHYALDVRWESALRHATKKIMVIDDIADRYHDCDVLLDQNYYVDMQTRYAGKVPASCQLMLGPRYALLRDEFRRLHEQVKPRSGPVKRVLVFFGGMDADNWTGQAIEALSGADIPDLQVDVVVGARHPCLELVEAVCMRHGFVCHVQTDRIAELMAAADLAVGAGGVASWERCCVGLPALAFCTADNQRRQLADAAVEGLLYSPEVSGDLARATQRHVCALLENNALRQSISRNGMQLVDGRGVSRVVTCMRGRDIEIRRAVPDDSAKLFQWRNHPSIRAVSRNTDAIEWQDHQQWFASVLNDSTRILVIGQSAGVPVGVVRFDMRDGEAEISIYLVPENGASGLGAGLLQSAERWLAAQHPEIRKVHAYVLGANIPSQRLFSSAGYQVESTAYSKELH